MIEPVPFVCYVAAQVKKKCPPSPRLLPSVAGERLAWGPWGWENRHGTSPWQQTRRAHIPILACHEMAKVRELYSPLPLATCSRQESLPQRRESRRAGRASHRVQWYRELTLDFPWAKQFNLSWRCVCAVVSVLPRECRWARPKGVKAEKVALLPAVCYTGWASWGSTGERARVVVLRGNWQAEQPSYHPGPEPGLWDGLPQQPHHLWTAGVCRGNESTSSKLQDIMTQSI